ncbi:MAG: Cysteinyl-tRNA ligase [Parcubacteria group bacterium GW2011_GWA2_37_10]|nr:MAG: Cysteinyl-tRNA ligase [Parcubacteria group bacterium GW2011_GWA2_37_10]
MKIYNTLSGKKEILKPIKGKKINLFVCGPTVYDYSHIGHARTYVSFDSFVKYLRELGYKVFYLQNITDLDDKIIARAREKGVPPKDLADAFGKEHLKNMKSLGVDSVTKYAKATSYIKQIISQIKRLQKKGFTYKIEGDGIYYSIGKFKNYGKLAGRTVLQAEDSVSRIDYSKDKKNRGDFCLWKFSSMEGEPKWKSPWGQGRPGWHIEDTAIAEKFFGSQYDIHGGARDLIFPHHEAEISQMETISGKRPMAKYWMHTGFLTVNGQKMSKSLGNFMTIVDFLRRHSVEYLRFLIVKNLWSSPLDYSDSIMIEIKSTIDKTEEFLGKLQAADYKAQTNSKLKIQIPKLLAKVKNDFYKQLDDNFNTPKAFAVLFEFIKEMNKIIDQNPIGKKDADKIYKFFEKINRIFGIINFKNIKERRIIPTEIKKLAKEREKYRQQQNWQKSDELRAEIEKQGFIIEDTSSGPVLKKI